MPICVVKWSTFVFLCNILDRMFRLVHAWSAGSSAAPTIIPPTEQMNCGPGVWHFNLNRKHISIS